MALKCTLRLVLAIVLMKNYGIKVNPFKVQDRNQNRMEFYYNLSGQLSTVMDTMGRLIYFELFLAINKTGIKFSKK